MAASIEAAAAAAPGWRALSFDDRAAMFLKAAELLAGAVAVHDQRGHHARPVQVGVPGRDRRGLRADRLLAYNTHFARRLLAEQPSSVTGEWDRLEYRPLEGFVLAITPFNFTSIAANLPTAPALLGNVVLWKPSPTQQFSAHYTMRLLEAAGLPAGVINLVTGDGRAVSQVALPHRDLAGIHFTGSTGTFQHLWRSVGENIASYRGYPRLVGETGGKDFVIAHPSADPEVLSVALIRGAFEYQGQKCSAASRAYIPRSVWDRMRDDFLAQVNSLTVGDVATDLSVFMGAVIDARAFRKLSDALARARSRPSIRVLVGGDADGDQGYFVQPTVLECSDLEDEVFRTEYFGPILAVHVFEDARYDEVVAQAANAAPYALTGAIIAQDRDAIAAATEALRFAAGNFYINDKPTGAVGAGSRSAGPGPAGPTTRQARSST